LPFYTFAKLLRCCVTLLDERSRGDPRREERALSKRAEITTAMRDGIRAGRWRPGEQLPTVFEVCKAFGVSTSTAVYGMRDLGDLVDARQGQGYYVADAAMERLQDTRPAIVAEAHTALVTLRDQLDQVIARLAA